MVSFVLLYTKSAYSTNPDLPELNGLRVLLHIPFTNSRYTKLINNMKGSACYDK